MLKLQKVCPNHVTDMAHVEYLGLAETGSEVFELLREYLWDRNVSIVSHPDAPKALVKLAARNLERNDRLVFSTKEDGVVWIDGVGPEMDFFQIIEVE